MSEKTESTVKSKGKHRTPMETAKEARELTQGDPNVVDLSSIPSPGADPVALMSRQIAFSAIKTSLNQQRAMEMESAQEVEKLKNPPPSRSAPYAQAVPFPLASGPNPAISQFLQNTISALPEDKREEFLKANQPLIEQLSSPATTMASPPGTLFNMFNRVPQPVPVQPEKSSSANDLASLVSTMSNTQMQQLAFAVDMARLTQPPVPPVQPLPSQPAQQQSVTDQMTFVRDLMDMMMGKFSGTINTLVENNTKQSDDMKSLVKDLTDRATKAEEEVKQQQYMSQIGGLTEMVEQLKQQVVTSQRNSLTSNNIGEILAQFREIGMTVGQKSKEELLADKQLAIEERKLDMEDDDRSAQRELAKLRLQAEIDEKTNSSKKYEALAGLMKNVAGGLGATRLRGNMMSGDPSIERAAGKFAARGGA